MALQDAHGEWIYDLEGIKNLTYNYFNNLFCTSQDSSVHNKITQITNQHSLDLLELGNIPSINEIQKTVFSFQPYKAPGPDGVHPFFYQNYWNIVGESIVPLCVKAF